MNLEREEKKYLNVTLVSIFKHTDDTFNIHLYRLLSSLITDQRHHFTTRQILVVVGIVVVMVVVEPIQTDRKADRHPPRFSECMRPFIKRQEGGERTKDLCITHKFNEEKDAPP